jgi:ribonuclease P protein component
MRGKLLKVWLLPEDLPNPQTLKLGVRVSRRVHLRAVKRNLWKRRIKEAYRMLQHEILPGRLILVDAQRQEKIPGYPEIKAELQKILKEMKALK